MVNKSTVPVGSTRAVEDVLDRRDVAVVSNPEFLREGTAVADFLDPDRVVIGADDRAAGERLAEVYAPLDAPVLITDPASAETIKYAANGFLAMKISFVNAIAAMCEAVGANVDDVVEGIGSDHRIGRAFLKPGPGWGGSCFPKDTRALVKIAADYGYDFTMMKGVIDVNEEQRRRMVGKVRKALGVGPGGGLRGALVGVLGLTFKAGTDDLRDSPSLTMVRSLLASGATVRAFDPTVEHRRRGGQGGSARRHRARRRRPRGGTRRAGARDRHGVARVRQARPRRARRGDGARRRGRRHPQPPRPGRGARGRARLRRRRPPLSRRSACRPPRAPRC